MLHDVCCRAIWLIGVLLVVWHAQVRSSRFLLLFQRYLSEKEHARGWEEECKQGCVSSRWTTLLHERQASPSDADGGVSAAPQLSHWHPRSSPGATARTTVIERFRERSVGVGLVQDQGFSSRGATRLDQDRRA